MPRKQTLSSPSQRHDGSVASPVFEAGRESEQPGVAASRSNQLHPAPGAGQHHCGHTRQADRRGVAQNFQAASRVVDARWQCAHRSTRQHEKVILLEQLIHVGAKCDMPLAQILDRGGGERCAPRKPFRDRLFKVLEISPMDRGCLMCLDAAENLPRVRPEIGSEGLDLRAAPLRSSSCQPLYISSTAGSQSCRKGPPTAAMITSFGAATGFTPNNAAASAGPSRRSRKSHPRVSNGDSQVPPALPGFLSAESESRAIASQPAERRRHADGAAGIGADRGNRRALLHAGRAPAGRSSGELHADRGAAGSCHTRCSRR